MGRLTVAMLIVSVYVAQNSVATAEMRTSCRRQLSRLHFKGRIVLLDSDDEMVVPKSNEEVDRVLEVTATELLVPTPPFVAVVGVSAVEDCGSKDTVEPVGRLEGDVKTSVETSGEPVLRLTENPEETPVPKIPEDDWTLDTADTRS